VLKLFKIAVTGPPGSGKTTALKVLAQLGAEVISADDIVHNLLLTDKTCIEELKQTLGTEITTEGQIDRKKVAEIVFSDPKKLKQLETIIHPRVRQALLRQPPKVNNIVMEVPLLFEAGWEADFDTILYITAHIDTRAKRFEKSHFQEREKHLLPEQEKIAKAHFVIKNDESQEKFQERIKTIYQSLKS